VFLATKSTTGWSPSSSSEEDAPPAKKVRAQRHTQQRKNASIKEASRMGMPEKNSKACDFGALFESEAAALIFAIRHHLVDDELIGSTCGKNGCKGILKYKISWTTNVVFNKEDVKEENADVIAVPIQKVWELAQASSKRCAGSPLQ